MKLRSLILLLVAQIAALSLWFVSAAILPSMIQEAAISGVRQAALSSGVQAGFVIGALMSAIVGLSDRYDPRYVFAISAALAGLINLLLLIAEPGGNAAIFARFLTGAFLAGVYPVGLRIAVSWGNKDRGLLVGALVGALTLGSALPYLFVLLGDANWRAIVGMSSIAAICAGLLCLATKLGPDYARASRFEPGALATAWHNRRVRLAYVGYLGHMWELYAMWAWVAAMAVASYSVTFAAPTAQQWANVTALIAIGIGAPMCVVAGALADRWGKARIAKYSMIASGAFAVATALSFGGPPVVSFVLFILWGATVVPDSALFSALVADAAPTAQTGSLMTLQTALGFALTFLTVQAAPFLASTLGWPVVMTLLALGPVIGVIAMQRLQHID